MKNTDLSFQEKVGSIIGKEKESAEQMFQPIIFLKGCKNCV